MTTWTRESLRHETMRRQALAERRSIDVTDAVRSLPALQAQEPAAPYLALWNRIEDFDADDLDRAFVEGSIVKATLLRFTLHAVAADDLDWIRAAMLGRARDAGYHDLLAASGLTADRLADFVAELSATITEPQGNAEMEQRLAQLLPGADDPARLWTALRAIGAFRNAPTADAWAFGRRPAFVPSPFPDLDQPTATAELIRRYLAAFGPATIADISQFTLLKRSTLKTVAESMPDVVSVADAEVANLLDVVVDGSGPAAEPPEPLLLPPRLLGMWDSVLLAYADRSRVIPDELRADVIRRNGDVLPTVLVDGLVRGVWRATPDAIEIRALTPIDDATLGALEREATDLRALVADRETIVFARVRRWWDRLPDGPTITLGA